MYIRIPLIILLSFLLSSAPGLAFKLDKVDSRKWTEKYDCYFRKYCKRYFGVGFDWKWFKAQAIAESNLNQQAESWVKAKGIMQIMPKTFEELRKKNPSFLNIEEPRWNIAAGIYYDQELYAKWKAPRPFQDKMNFTFASYNAGFYTILRAQKYCKQKRLNENLWRNVEKVAPAVPSWRHSETLSYVEKINHMMP